MSENNGSLLNAALAYAELGYPVFPCAPQAKTPLTEHGLLDASTEAYQIEQWWCEQPTANVAIVTEGLLVIDVDGQNNSWLANDPDKLLDLANAALSLTPNGGRHYIFRQPTGKTWRGSAGKLAAKVDVRANGNYIIVPPSVLGEDKVYRWAETLELDQPASGLPEPPPWLTELLDRIATGATTLAHGAINSPAGNVIPAGQRNGTLARLAGNMRRVGMSQAEILAALEQVNADRCQPPVSRTELEKIAASIARYEPDQVSVALVEDHWAQDVQNSGPPYISGFDLCQNFSAMCKPVIHGLLREGETMNVIAAPKTGKSWLVLNLALSVVTGMAWMEFPTEPGRVLLIDNELHPETLANRIPRVSGAMKLQPSSWKDGLFVKTLRGQLEDLFRMEAYFQTLPEGFFKLIILDAFYRFMPRNMDENDNGTMANLYNVIDRCAARLQAGFVLIHHTTKGLQSTKAVTDVGAGAGSQSRAADCHLILRPHEQDGCLVVDGAVRSWPPPQPFVIRQAFPLWIPDQSLDPAELKKPYQKSRKRAESGDSDEPSLPEWTPESFVAQFIGAEPKAKYVVLASANEQGLSDYRAEKLLRNAEAAGLVHRWHLGGNRPGFATVPPDQEADHDQP